MINSHPFLEVSAPVKRFGNVANPLRLRRVKAVTTATSDELERNRRKL
jgi:hypothetical protein